MAAFLRATSVVAVRSPSSILRLSSVTCCLSFSLVCCALIHGCLHGGDLLVALGLLGQRLARQVFIAGVERHARAVFPFLRLAHVFLILGVQAVVIAHGHGGGRTTLFNSVRMSATVCLTVASKVASSRAPTP